MLRLKRVVRQLANDLEVAWRFANTKREPSVLNVCHLGAWTGNMGDAVLLSSIQQRLIDRMPQGISLNFVPLNVQLTRIDKSFVRKLNNGFDLLLIGGGGLFLYKPESRSRSGWQLDITEPEIGMIDLPIVVYGIGYNQFALSDVPPPAVAAGILRALVEKSRLFAARDEGSRTAFIAMGANPSLIEVIPDPAMWLEPVEVSIPGFIRDEVNIGINLAADRLNWRFPTPALENAKLWTEELAAAVKEVLDDMGGNAYYIPHMLGTDGIYTSVLRNKLGSRFRQIDELLPALFPPRISTARQFVSVYQKMSLVIGMRGHANIIPFGVGTPVIAVSSHNKNRFFMDQIGMSEYVIDTSQPVNDSNKIQIRSLIRNILGNREDLALRYKLRKEELAKVADAFDQKIMEILAR